MNETTRGLGTTNGRRIIRATAMKRLIGIAEELDKRDCGTSRHCQTVARYAETIARELELAEEVVEAVALAGLLHDVGKICVPDRIVAKAGPLSAREWDEMRAHPRIGAEILDGAGLEDIREWIFAHHERPDGNGYPRGLNDEQIPIEAKILAVADSYEAMTNDRAYRLAIGRKRAIAELRANTGTQFDAIVVDAFLTALERESAPVTGAL
jgi:putative nucleotidyltransferase with HDIG domain